MKLVLIALASSLLGILSGFLPNPIRTGLFTLAVFWVLVLAMNHV